MKILKNILAAMVILMCAISCIKDDEPVQADLQVGDSIPDFTVQMNDGSIVTGAQLRSGTAVIMFFNTGCLDCQKTLPSVQKIYDEYESLVKFALVGREQTEEEINPYWVNNRYTMPYSPQNDRVVYNLFASSSIPRIYVCQQGIIRYMYDDNPIPSYDDLDRNLKNILN